MLWNIRGKSNEWFRSYLASRRQYVVINEKNLLPIQFHVASNKEASDLALLVGYVAYKRSLNFTLSALYT